MVTIATDSTTSGDENSKKKSCIYENEMMY